MTQPDSASDRAEMGSMFSIRANYRAPCKMYNWNEDLFLTEERTSYATYKRERCQLILQKTRKMFRNLSRPTQLSHSLGMLRYNENYQIKAPDISRVVADSKLSPVYLAGLVTETEIDRRQEFSHGSLIVGCIDGKPCVRNTFRIIGCDRNKSGEPVNYGEDVYIQIVDDCDVPLYIQCENSFIQMGSRLHPRLSKYTDTYCRFKIHHLNPNLRFEHEGSLIKANDQVVIQHVPTGRNLAVENSLIATFFGKEHVISCHTFKDTHKMETAENIWKIVGEDLPNINAVVRAAKGEEVLDELIR
ncbi:hypothetical protein HHI36_008073 [Cryptolaemus montrouzieri]